MPPDLFPPEALLRDSAPPLSDYGWRLLAEGDSWFSITATGRYSPNLLAELRLPRSAAIVNCAARATRCSVWWTAAPTATASACCTTAAWPATGTPCCCRPAATT